MEIPMNLYAAGSSPAEGQVSRARRVLINHYWLADQGRYRHQQYLGGLSNLIETPFHWVSSILSLL